ncbi:MAG TPA: tetratricopeptide repeat protein [Ktedonobacteraceae bacterium]|nr:tetratricopeptide repeat protein [Ktedonobacteraceae bacterium]
MDQKCSKRWRLRGMVHPAVATSLRGLALVYYRQGRYEEDEHLYQRALSIREQTQGLEHPNAAMLRADLTSLYCDLGRYEEAESVYQRALSIQEDEHGSDYPGLASLLVPFGNLYRTLQNYGEAEALYMRALAIQKRGSDVLQHIGISAALHELAELLEKQDNTQAAISFYKQALTIRKKVLGASFPGKSGLNSPRGGGISCIVVKRKTFEALIRSDSRQESAGEFFRERF